MAKRRKRNRTPRIVLLFRVIVALILLRFTVVTLHLPIQIRIISSRTILHVNIRIKPISQSKEIFRIILLEQPIRKILLGSRIAVNLTRATRLAWYNILMKIRTHTKHRNKHVSIILNMDQLATNLVARKVLLLRRTPRKFRQVFRLAIWKTLTLPFVRMEVGRQMVNASLTIPRATLKRRTHILTTTIICRVVLLRNNQVIPLRLANLRNGTILYRKQLIRMEFGQTKHQQYQFTKMKRITNTS